MIEVWTFQNMQSGVSCCHGNYLKVYKEEWMLSSLHCASLHRQGRRRSGPGVSDTTITCLLSNVNPKYMCMYILFKHDISSTVHTHVCCQVAPYCKTAYYAVIHYTFLFLAVWGQPITTQGLHVHHKSCTSESCLFISYGVCSEQWVKRHCSIQNLHNLPATHYSKDWYTPIL